MDRRDFFRSAFRKTSEVAVKQIDKRVAARAARWIRPPFVEDELDFLMACTRCGDCVTACPHDVIFTLSSRLGAQVVGTAAMDILNKGCHLCGDWPCVNSCKPGALSLPSVSNDDSVDEAISIPLPKLAKAKVDTSACLAYNGPECGACSASCKVEGALLWKSEKPHINEQLCVGCGMCLEQCIVEPKAIIIESLHVAMTKKDDKDINSQ